MQDAVGTPTVAAACAGNHLIRLVDRPADAKLFAGAAGSYSTADFLRDANACAATLPDCSHIVNCCQDRYRFAVLFAAALLRGQTTLLTGDQSPRALASLARRFPGLHAVHDAAVTRGDASPENPLIPADRLAAIVFTSGSSGEPVANTKTFGELAARSALAALRFGITGTDPATIIGTVPPNHMYGFETTVLLPLHAPAASWCDAIFYPADATHALDAVPGRRILVTTPLQLRGMLQVAPPAQPPAAIISATAPLDRSLAQSAEGLWRTQVLEIFGATEVGSIASRRTVSDDAWWLYPGVTLRGTHPPTVSAPHAAHRCINDEVELLEGGRFRLIGRCSDMIKLGGRRASLAALTRTLNELDGVEDAVFVAPDDLDTSPTARLLAFVVAPGLSREQVLDALRQRIDPVFLPRPLLQVKALPRNALGKLPRRALLELALDGV